MKQFVRDIVAETLVELGPVHKTPDSYANNLIQARRQTGRTRFMIDCFPNEGKFFVITWSTMYGVALKASTAKFRGEEVADNLIIVSLSALEQLRGTNSPIFIDDVVFDMLTVNLHEKINNNVTTDICEILRFAQKA